MGGPSSVPPGPPWFPKAEAPLLPKIVANGPGRGEIELPFLRYALIDEEPMILGTTGHEQEVYGEKLLAGQAPIPSIPLHIDDTQLDSLYEDHPFNWAINFALFRLSDPGVLADVHRYRTAFLRLKGLKHKNDRLTRIISTFQKEQKGHNREIRTFTHKVEEVKGRLIAAKVRSRVTPILARMAVEGMIADPIYPYKPAVEDPPVEGLKGRPPTPRPPNPPPSDSPSGSSRSCHFNHNSRAAALLAMCIISQPLMTIL
ncbi:hypothetical protein F5888DRAFT_1804070 [Russula emetica]|nr:hypothetical protein F5888DRAFT_1804070 [Russula emetica]